MAHFLIIRAEDGEHISRFKDERSARIALTKQVGRFCPDDRVVDDFGRVLKIEEWPDRVTLADRRGLGRAYDARECGVATKAQLSLLARMGE